MVGWRIWLICLQHNRIGQDLYDFIAFFNVEPNSDGLSATRTAAARSEAIFSFAPADPPEMMAPACPMRLPGGAVWPAMKAATGFLEFPEPLYSAASSPAFPPAFP